MPDFASRRFAHDFDNDRRASEGCDPASRYHCADDDESPEAPDGSHTLNTLLFLRESPRARLALDCLILLHRGDRFLPELSRRWISKKYDVSPTTVGNMCDRVDQALAAGGRPIDDAGTLRLLLFLRGGANLRLTLDGLILAYGGNRLLPEITMRSSARRFGISVTTVSNACGRIQRLLHLPRNQNNKPEAARRSYALLNYRPALGDAG